ncbi:phosphonate ABC transporter ATP-binding protein [Aidingimonas lacisalsi]|uniref:phosphonate ABC transporter ATP-binding protein n=1 Tax=Aidingimonas lacisalsi TaxID=2604086 RepID=UPI0011D1B25D|nr:ATP-binding cassette domain-containing protein [Aidingimonas lacisalsi]
MTAIQVQDLHKSFDSLHVLRGIDFEIAQGECVILLGANGCGKSTLMRCLNGLERPDRGNAYMHGTDIATADARQLCQLRRQVGVVFQQFNLVQNLSVFQNVLYGAMGEQRFGLLATLSPLANDALRERAMYCLERVSLADKAKHKCREISGGQQQRVAIARTLMQEPSVLIADEPVASLDPSAGRNVMNLLMAIVEEQRMTVLCSLHQLELASEYGDRLIGMKAGRIELDASRDTVDHQRMASLYQGDVRVDHVPTTHHERPVTASV